MMETSTLGSLPPTTGALLSPCRLYRYTLWRRWRPGKPLVFVLLNPSVADDRVNDATISRLIARAKLLNYGSILVVNLFAFRATRPEDMRAAADPVGPENDSHIREALRRAGMVIGGWGTHGRFRGRDQEVLTLMREAGVTPRCLKQNADGSPQHPLYLSYDMAPVPMVLRGTAP